MAKNKLKEHSFVSGEKPRSSILNGSFVNRLNSLFGFRTTAPGTKPETAIEGRYGLKFVRVDMNNPAYRVQNAVLGATYSSTNFSQTLEKYFDSYLRETTTSYDDIVDRQQRLNELSFAYYNDCFFSRACHLVADECTQLDVQDRLITIESPDTAFMEKTYELLNSWGITPQRTNAACFDLQLYGESFWAHKIGLNGVEKIKPIPVNDIIERLEFSPTHVAKYLAERDGWQSANKDRGSKLAKLVDMLKGEDSLETAENLSDMFDDKLLGYELHDGILAPPWLITHFRYNADHSEFYPYGRPPLLAALAPFKQSHATMALQGLARQMSFPVTLYKVKSTEGMLPAQAFDIVNTVRQQYDNIGVTPGSQGSEIYTVNTKIWVPEGLLDMEVIESKCDIDFVGDLENYQNRVAFACGVPKGYIDPNEDGGGYQSGVALTKQYKPFARHVYTVQTAFLSGLGELIRLHYAITGEYDYNTPFILSMRFPAEEETDEKRQVQTATMKLSADIIDLIKNVLGIEEDEALPEDVVTDILSKYSFLDPTDIQKWMRLSAFLKPLNTGDDEKSGGGDTGGDDFGDDFGGDDVDVDFDLGESLSREEILKNKRLLHERNIRLAEKKKERLNEIRTRYKASSNEIYFKFLESNNFTEWPQYNQGTHKLFVPKIASDNPMYETFMVLTADANRVPSEKEGFTKLREALEYTQVVRCVEKPKPKDVATRSITEAMEEAAQASRLNDTRID